MAGDAPKPLWEGLDNMPGFLSEEFQLKAPDYSSYLPDMRSTWRQLVVIGNGFDLACGLKSDFKSFFEPRLKKGKAIEQGGVSGGKSVGSQLRDAGLTAWDIILGTKSRGEMGSSAQGVVRA